MATNKILSVALRLIFICVALGLGYALWTSHLSAVGSILFGIGGVILGRWMYKARITPNPLGDADRDFGLRPVVRDILKGAICFGVAFLWVIAGTVEVRRQALPDTYWAVIGLVVGPPVLLMLGGTFFIGRGGYKAMFGRSKS